LPFRLAVPAAFRLVLEVFLVVKLLFTRGEDKIRTAIHALENPILKFHGTILEKER
jgi:hypothetical protein